MKKATTFLNLTKTSVRNAKTLNEKKKLASSADQSKAITAPPIDWRAETLSRVRKLILQADPVAVEEIKWRKPSNGMQGVPVWSHAGILCTGETYKDKVKLTFAKGAALDDPSGLFNSSLDGNARRAIDFHEGEKIDAKAFKALVREAVAQNIAPIAGKAKGRQTKARKAG